MINFVQVEHAVRDLKLQFVEGHFDEQTFKNRLLDLIDIAPDNNYWMFGHESEQWYRHNGDIWLLDTPNFDTSTEHPPHNSALISDNAGWHTINLGWFIASLVILITIGSIVYISV